MNHEDTAPIDATPVTGRCIRVRCPHCHAPIDIESDRDLAEVVCPSCGSGFNLASHAERTREAPSLVSVAQFELVERIGIGGFGSVWKARDTDLDRLVAVKLPHQSNPSEEEAKQFLREAQAAAKLSHPNIVAVHEVGRDGSSIFIVCDLVRGVTLDDWITAKKPTVEEAVEICIKIARAIQHAHDEKVIHRDLKPSNIMLTADGEPYLTDFGLARLGNSEVTVTAEGQIFGTPAYMSPEQAKGDGKHADHRTDIYSLGVILFKLLTGELPFRGTPRMQTFQVEHRPPPSPRTLCVHISKDMESITLKCLEKDPRKRYQTAEEFAQDCERYVDGKEIIARPLNIWQKIGRLYRYEPIASRLTAGGLTVCSATVVVIWNVIGMIAYAFGFAVAEDWRIAIAQLLITILLICFPLYAIGFSIIRGSNIALWVGLVFVVLVNGFCLASLLGLIEMEIVNEGGDSARIKTNALFLAITLVGGSVYASCLRFRRR